MKLMRAIVALLVVIGLMVPAMPILASGSDGVQEYAPDRILVAFKAEVTAAGRNAVQQRHGDNDYRDVPGVGVRVVKVPPGLSGRAGCTVCRAGLRGEGHWNTAKRL
jgi:hypothetical protein